MKWSKHADSNAWKRVYVTTDPYGITWRAEQRGKGNPWYLHHDGPQGTVSAPSSPARTLSQAKHWVKIDTQDRMQRAWAWRVPLT